MQEDFHAVLLLSVLKVLIRRENSVCYIVCNHLSNYIYLKFYVIRYLSDHCDSGDILGIDYLDS